MRVEIYFQADHISVNLSFVRHLIVYNYLQNKMHASTVFDNVHNVIVAFWEHKFFGLELNIATPVFQR